MARTRERRANGAEVFLAIDEERDARCALDAPAIAPGREDARRTRWRPGGRFAAVGRKCAVLVIHAKDEARLSEPCHRIVAVRAFPVCRRIPTVFVSVSRFRKRS